jgi:hypothetical protein
VPGDGEWSIDGDGAADPPGDGAVVGPGLAIGDAGTSDQPAPVAGAQAATVTAARPPPAMAAPRRKPRLLRLSLGPADASASRSMDFSSEGRVATLPSGSCEASGARERSTVGICIGRSSTMR